MNQSTLEAISITALVVALVVLLALVLRWIVKRWFVGSWADKIIGGKRTAVGVRAEDVTNFGANCRALQDAIINGTPITRETMIPIINTIYLAFRMDYEMFDYYRGGVVNNREWLCETVTNGLKAVPLAALILMASPYMFRPRVRNLLDNESIYQMLSETVKDRDIMESLNLEIGKQNDKELLFMRYFDPICRSIRMNIDYDIDYDYIRSAWSNGSVSLMTIATVFISKVANGRQLRATTENIAKALKEIVIPDIYETLITNGANIPLNGASVPLSSLPTEGEPKFKGQ